MIDALAWIVLGICIGWTASRMTDAEREAESWGRHLQDWDGTDYDVVFTPEPYDWQNEGSKKLGWDLRIKRRHPWNP